MPSGLWETNHSESSECTIWMEIYVVAGAILKTIGL